MKNLNTTTTPPQPEQTIQRLHGHKNKFVIMWLDGQKNWQYEVADTKRWARILLGSKKRNAIEDGHTHFKGMVYELDIQGQPLHQVNYEGTRKYVYDVTTDIDTTNDESKD